MSGSERKTWRVNRTPRFTVLDMGEYMVIEDGPRETMRRNMKYERIYGTTLYSKLNRAVARYLASPIRDQRILGECRRMLEGERDSATSPKARENATYAIRSLDAFERSLNALPIAGLNLELAPLYPVRVFGRVKLSIQPTLLVRVVRPRGKDLRGAIIVDTAKGIEPKTDSAKERAQSAMLHTAFLLHEHVAASVVMDGERSSPEHCMVFHVHRQALERSPTNYRTMLRNVEAACRGIADAWNNIDPPPGFDPDRAQYRS